MSRACHHCGGPLAAEHRFCASCGTPAPTTAEAMDSTRERPAVPASAPASPPPPPVVPPNPPPSPRYPLFADEVAPDAGPTPPPPRREAAPGATTAVAEPAATTSLLGGEPDDTAPRTASGARSRLPWLVAALALALMAAFGTVLMLSGGNGDTAADVAEPAGGSDGEAADPEPGSGQGGAEQKQNKKGDKQKSESKPGEPVDVAREASATVPATAPPNEDVEGNLVRYEARNMLDGVPSTAWRMPDSAAGEQVVLQLDGKKRLTQVGIINGYAKSSGGMNWYEGNRRIRKVVWVFDDGKRVEHELDDVPKLQTRKIKPVTTESVKVRITRVSTPGGGTASRNFTAISDISLLGTPAS